MVNSEWREQVIGFQNALNSIILESEEIKSIDTLLVSVLDF